MLTLDVHTHMIPPDLPTGRWGDVDGKFLRIERSADDERRAFIGSQLVRTVDGRAWDAASRLAAMDKAHVDVHVVSPTPFTFLYDTPEDVARGVARWQNDYIAAMCSANRERLRAFGSLPLGHPSAALDEIRYLDDELGLDGVEIGTHAAEIELDDERLRPVFAELERRRLPVLVHPYEARQPVPPGLVAAVGYPLATADAIVRLLWGGVMERFPELRVCFAHGGGCITTLTGRLQATYERFPQRTGELGEAPIRALRRLWFDSLVFRPEILALLVATVGPKMIVSGSDFPFRMSDDTILARAVTAGAITDEQGQAIASSNPQSFLDRTHTVGRPDEV